MVNSLHPQIMLVVGGCRQGRALWTALRPSLVCFHSKFNHEKHQCLDACVLATNKCSTCTMLQINHLKLARKWTGKLGQNKGNRLAACLKVETAVVDHLQYEHLVLVCCTHTTGHLKPPMLVYFCHALHNNVVATCTGPSASLLTKQTLIAHRLCNCSNPVTTLGAN